MPRAPPELTHLAVIRKQISSNQTMSGPERPDSDADPGPSTRVNDQGDGNNNAHDVKPEANPPKLVCKTREEYIQQLNNWLLACQYWHLCSQLVGSSLLASTLPSSGQTQSHHLTERVPRATEPDVSPSQTFIVPKVWKRVVAEVIDFFILLVMKIAVTYIAIDSFDLIDLSKYDLNLMEEEFDAYELALELTSEILVIESVHRLIVIVYETIFLTRCISGRIGVHGSGGSTPGKKIMGLRVVSCMSIQDLPDGRILVSPAQDIGFWYSLLRAIIKNFSSIMFLPASLTIFISSQNRAAYDIACRCVVVQEENRRNH